MSYVRVRRMLSSGSVARKNGAAAGAAGTAAACGRQTQQRAGQGSNLDHSLAVVCSTHRVLHEVVFLECCHVDVVIVAV